MRNPELTTQTIQSPESHRHSIGETPLFEQLKLEYLKNQGDSDMEPVTSKNGAAISMLLEGTGNEAARSTYKDIWETVPDDATEAGMQVYLEQSYREAQKEDPEFLRPAAVYTADNKTYWNASTKQGTTGIALVSDKSSIRLGSDETAGIIEGPLLDGHKLVIADNALLDQLDQNGALNLKAIERLDDNGERELYPFYSAVVMDNDNLYASDHAPKHRMDDGEREALRRTVIERKLRARKNLGLSPDASDTEVAQAKKARRIANRQAELTGDVAADEDDTTSTPENSTFDKASDTLDATSGLGISEMVHLAERVAKYEEKVSAYEDIAAQALAKRMKGRLFKPLTRKGKENAKTDDLNMHLLEGFSRALDGAMMKQWLAEGYTDDEAAQMLYEQQQTRQEARAARNREEFRKDKLGSFLDKYANMPKGKKIGVAIGAAAAFGAIGVVAGAAGGAAAVVGGIGLAGVKVGKTYLQHRSKIYETGKDESMTPPDRATSIANGQAAKRTAAQQVFAGMEHDEKKRERAIEKSDRNKKVAAGLAAAAGLLLGAGIAAKVAEHSDDIQAFWNKPLEPKVPSGIGNADGEWVTQVPAPEAPHVPIPLQPEFSADAMTVTSGEGWYQTIQETTGITNPAKQAAILQKIGPVLQEKGWAYPMSDGTWGISRPGTLPKDVLELIKNSR